MTDRWFATLYIGVLVVGIGLYVGNYVAWFAWAEGMANPTVVGAVAMCVVSVAMLTALAIAGRKA